MKYLPKFISVLIISALMFIPGCDLIAGVFKAGFVTAIIVVVIIIALIIYLIKKLL